MRWKIKFALHILGFIHLRANKNSGKIQMGINA